MRRYETTVIINPDQIGEERNSFIKRIEELIEKEQGSIIQINEWGSRQLAYEIKKKSYGYYVLFDYCGHGALVKEMERIFRINENVLRYMTVLIDTKADPDRVREELANAAAASEQTFEENRFDNEDYQENSDDEN